MNRSIVQFGIALLVASAVSPLLAQDDDPQRRRSQASSVVVAQTYRASVLSDMEVRNPQGEDLGEIKDLVVDLENNEIRYVALSVGGFLGIGDKLVAVPMQAMKFVHDAEENYFVLDADKRTLEQAPGFDDENWPDVADPRWAEEVDKRFGSIETVMATVEQAGENMLVVKSGEGEAQKLKVGPKTVVMVDGERADLADLQQGQKVRIQTVEEEGARVVRTIEARTPRQEQPPREQEERE